MSINLTVTESTTQLTLILTEQQNVITVNPTLNVSSTGISESSIDTIAKLNAIVTDANLDDTNTSRPPTSHTHDSGDLTDFNAAVDARLTINSTVTGEPTGSDVVLNIVSLTQAEYNAGSPVATTFYIITDA